MLFRSEIDENTYASLSFAKEYQTNPNTEDLFDYRQAAIRFGRKISRRLTYFLSGFYGEGEYIALNITDRLRGANVVISYNLKKNLELKLTHTYSDTQSTIDTREYTKNVTSLGLNMKF